MKFYLRSLTTVLILTFILPGIALSDCMPVKDAQQILKELNYYPETPDGIMGTSTIKILKTFQMDSEIPMTGNLDKATCEKLFAEKNKLKTISSQTAAKTIKKNPLDSSKTIKMLMTLGYYSGPEDPKNTLKLRESLIIFQNENNLSPTGLEDEETIRKLFSGKANHHVPEKTEPQKPDSGKPDPEKPDPEKTDVTKTDPGKKPEDKTKKSMAKAKKADGKKTASFKFAGYEISYINLGTKSTYNTKSFESMNKTLNKEGYSTFVDDTAITHVFSGGNDSLSVSALAGSSLDCSNMLLGIDLAYRFNYQNHPLTAKFHFSDFESDIITNKGNYDEKQETVDTMSISAAILYRLSPRFSTGLQIAYTNYPALVSVKNDVDEMQALFFDEDLKITAINAEFDYDSTGSKFRHLDRNFKKFSPYVTLNYKIGFAMGEISADTAKAAATILNSTVDETVYGINMQAVPEAGFNYRLHTRNYDMNLKLGYRVVSQWPLWDFSTSQMTDGPDTFIGIYRKDINHGPVLGCEVLF